MELPHLEGQIGVLEIGRRKLGTKAPHLLPEGQWDRQRCSADVIHLARVSHFWVVGVATTAVVPGLPIAPHDPARFLQAAVRKDQLRPHHPGGGPAAKRLQQFLQPAATGLGVVVEQNQKLAAGQIRSAVAGLVKTQRPVVANAATPLHVVLEGLTGAIG